MKFNLPVLIALIFVFSFTSGIAQRSQLVKIRETDSTLKVPESVLYYAPEKAHEHGPCAVAAGMVSII